MSNMFTPLSLFLGLRYVRSRQSQGFASFISASSTLGIGLGVMVLIIVLSAMNGFERELANRLLSIVPHGEFTAVNEPINNWQQQLTELEQDSSIVAAAPVIKMTGMIQKAEKIKALEIRGVDLVKELEVSSIGDYVPQEQWQALAQDDSIVIGSGIADKLSVTIGDVVQVLLPRKSGTSKSFSAPIKLNLTIVGTFDVGGTVDESLAYISLASAAQAINLGDDVQGIRIKVKDVFLAPQITRKVANSIDAYVYIDDWTRSQGHLFNDIQLVRLVMFIVLVLVIAVASFNIVSTLIMAVNDKKGDIAILMTMGASRATIMFTFIIQGLFNGLLGAVFGAALGAYIAIYLTEIITTLEVWLGISFLSGEVYFVDFMPTYLQTSDVVFTIVTALTLTLCATIYPAWRATKIEPAQVLGQL